jgi:hypothetical protein
MMEQLTIDGTPAAPVKPARRKERRQFAACPSCGGTHFVEEQYPAYLQWRCRIGLDGYATDYSRTPEIDGDPEVLSYTCTGCGAEYRSANAVVRAADDE